MEQGCSRCASGDTIATKALCPASRDYEDFSGGGDLKNPVLTERGDIDISRGIDSDAVRVIKICIESGDLFGPPPIAVEMTSC